MRNLSVVLNVILFLLVGVLFFLHFSGRTPAVAAATPGEKSADAATGSSCNIAYVNIDSLEEHYTYFKEKKDELEKKQRSIEQELNGNAQALQNEVAQLRQKAATMTQAEGEAAQKSIMQKQQALQQKEQNLQQQFMQQQAQFNDELQRRLDDFLTKYNADKKYTYILSYSKGMSNILYKDAAYDITNAVIAGLNAAEEKK